MLQLLIAVALAASSNLAVNMGGQHLLDYRGAAERWGVSVDFIKRLVGSGRLRSVRLGYRTVRIDPLDLDEYFAQHKVGGDR